MTAISVLGAGCWGTVLGNHLAGQGHDVVLWTRDPERARALNELHRSPASLPGRALAPSLRATTDLEAAVRGRDLLVCAVPSQAVRPVLQQAARTAGEAGVLVGTSKGIEVDTLERMSEIAAGTLPGWEYVAFSGPSFALEVIDGQPTAFRARDQQELLPTFHQLKRTNDDVVLRWFARGRLWESQQLEREARRQPKPAAAKRGRCSVLGFADFVADHTADRESGDRAGEVAAQSRPGQAARERAGDGSDMGSGCIRHARAERQAQRSRSEKSG